MNGRNHSMGCQFAFRDWPNSQLCRSRVLLCATSICISLLVPRFVFASADSDEIARETAKAAAETYAKEAVRHYLDKTLPLSPPGSSGTPGVGTVVLSAVQIAIAANDYANAKTDPQRVNATADAGVAVYALAAGPYAPVVAVAYTVTKLLQAGAEAQHQRKMLEIYKQIEEDVQATTVIYQSIAIAEVTNLQTIYLSAVGSSATVDDAKAFLEEHCLDSAKMDTPEKLDMCLTALSNLSWHAHNFLRNVDMLLSWKGQFISGDRFLDSMKDKPRQTLVESRKNYQEFISGSDKLMQGFRANYGSLLSRMLLREASDRAVTTNRELATRNCTSKYAVIATGASSLNLQFAVARLSAHASDVCPIRTRLLGMSQSIEEFPRDLCEQISRGLADSPTKTALEGARKQIDDLDAVLLRNAKSSRRLCHTINAKSH
jgi:hypothetical protein